MALVLVHGSTLKNVKKDGTTADPIQLVSELQLAQENSKKETTPDPTEFMIGDNY